MYYPAPFQGEMRTSSRARWAPRQPRGERDCRRRRRRRGTRRQTHVRRLGRGRASWSAATPTCNAQAEVARLACQRTMRFPMQNVPRQKRLSCVIVMGRHAVCTVAGGARRIACPREPAARRCAWGHQNPLVFTSFPAHQPPRLALGASGQKIARAARARRGASFFFKEK